MIDYSYNCHTDCYHIGYDILGRAVWMSADCIEEMKNKKEDEEKKKIKIMLQKD